MAIARAAALLVPLLLVATSAPVEAGPREEAVTMLWDALLNAPGGALTRVTSNIHTPVVAGPTCKLGVTQLGCEVWRASVGPSSWSRAARVVESSPDGATVYAAVPTIYTYSTGIVSGVRAIDAATGKERWTTTMNYENNWHNAVPVALAASPDGSVVFVGLHGGPPSAYILALDAATGRVVWETEIPETEGPRWVEGLVIANGSVFYTGGAATSTGATGFGLVRLDAATGAPTYSRVHLPSGVSAVPRALTASPDGLVLYAAGAVRPSATEPTDMATMAFDAATGDLLWHAVHGAHAGYGAGSVETSADGTRVYVGGSGRWFSTYDTRGVLLAYDAATGVESWAKTFGVADVSGGVTGIAVSPSNGDIYASASFGSHASARAAIVAYSSSGSFRWGGYYDGAPGGAADVAVSDDGSRIALVGYADGGETELDYLTLLIDRHSGRIQQGARYHGASANQGLQRALTDVADDATFLHGTNRLVVGGFSHSVYPVVAYDT